MMNVMCNHAFYFQDDDDPQSELSSVQETVSVRSGDIGILVSSRPIVYGVRLLASRFLLTGYPNGHMTDRMSRVSVKTLAMNCIAASVAVYPQVFAMKLFVGEGGSFSVLIF